MGDLLHFPVERTNAPRREPAATPAFFFDVTSPACYLVAERVERTLGDVEWVAVDSHALGADAPRGRELARLRRDAETRAQALRLPLIWPDRFPMQSQCAMRAAAFACELGAGPAFALAAGRLAFCGGYDLEDPEVIAEAAAAAALPLGACLEAAGERWRDDELREVARTLSEAGVDELPAFAVGHHWLQGEAGLAQAPPLIARAEPVQRPLAPVG